VHLVQVDGGGNSLSLVETEETSKGGGSRKWGRLFEDLKGGANSLVTRGQPEAVPKEEGYDHLTKISQKWVEGKFGKD